MKYSLTIHDLNASQVTDLMSRVENATITTVRPDNVVAFNHPVAAALNEAGMNPATSPHAIPPIGSPEAIAAAANAANANTLLTASTSELLKSAGGAEVDSENLPWDGRIHSGSKKKNTDGKWKLLKNVDPALVASVKAELFSRPPVNPVAAPIATPAVPAFLTKEVAAANASAPATVPATSVAPVIPPVAAPVAAPIMAQPQAPLTRDFSGLMQQISKLFATKQITPDYPNTIVARVNQGFNVNIATLTDVQNDPRMVEYSWQCLEVDQKAA